MGAEFPVFDCLWRPVSVAAFAIVILASTAFTQSQTGTLVGLIDDAQGKAINGVEVQLFPADASQPHAYTITDAAGNFQFVGLLPGTYSLELSLSGWQSQHLSNLKVEAARTLDVNLALAPAAPALSQRSRSFQLLDRDVLVGTQFDEVSLELLGGHIPQFELSNTGRIDDPTARREPEQLGHGCRVRTV